MIRRNFPLLITWFFLLASCGPKPTPIQPTSTPSPTTAPTHAPEIRFALIGEPRDENVWKLFDESGASYPDYALRSEYWPRLYHLVPPQFDFQPMAADGMPSAVIQDGDFFSATVKLRTNLKWTDGTSFTAEDVAFTVNNALAFELSYDWRDYYPPEYIKDVEVVDSSTVKFIFKQKPNVSVWQYGALQGPIVQKAYWKGKIDEPSVLLPDSDLREKVDDARAYVSKVQVSVDNLNGQLTALRLTGRTDRQVESSLSNAKGELTFAQNGLNKLLEGYASKIKSAREVLFALSADDEPTLGTWIPAGKEDNAWVNKANPDFPFAKPNFDRAVYFPFQTEQDAEKAVEEDKVDVILNPEGTITPHSNSSKFMSSPKGNIQFLVVNPLKSVLTTTAFRQALACIIALPNDTNYILTSDFILPGNNSWLNSDAKNPCIDVSDSRLDYAVQLLKSAGYTWTQEPTKDTPGNELNTPDAQPFPAIKILSAEDNSPGEEQINNIAEQVSQLGIPITVQPTSSQDIRYEVFSSKKYDMAILSWNLSLYPGYLCEWFGGDGKFFYGSDRIKSDCEALKVESDLTAAQKSVFDIQVALAQDLPFIPLYADIRYDAYRNIHYPFDSVLGGLGGLYGAPSYAMP